MVRHRQCAKRLLTAHKAVAAAMIFAVLSIGGCEKTPTGKHDKSTRTPRPAPEITISLHLSLHVPDYSELKTLQDEYNKPKGVDVVLDWIPEVAVIRWLMRKDLPEKENDGSRVYVIARAAGSNVGYCDGAARTDILGRTVNFAFTIPRKHLGEPINFEIWQDNSDDPKLKTFFESIKANLNEVDTQGGASLPNGVSVNARRKVSGTLSFEFAHFAKVFDEKDGLWAALHFELSSDRQPEKPVLDSVNKATKVEVSKYLRYKNTVDMFLAEAMKDGLLHEQVNTFYVPFGTARIDVSDPNEE